MYDHYSRSELAFKLNCHVRELGMLSTLGRGFDFARIYPTTAPRYIVKKADVYAWMDEVRYDDALMSAARKIAPHISFHQLMRECARWKDFKRQQQRGRTSNGKKAYERA